MTSTDWNLEAARKFVGTTLPCPYPCGGTWTITSVEKHRAFSDRRRMTISATLLWEGTGNPVLDNEETMGTFDEGSMLHDQVMKLAIKPETRRTMRFQVLRYRLRTWAVEIGATVVPNLNGQQHDEPIGPEPERTCDGLGTGIGAEGYFSCPGCSACESDEETYPDCPICGEPIDYCPGHGGANACEGHPAGPNDPMGVTVFCDGSCAG